MKGLNKCSGLLLLFSITLLSSLSVSLDTNALKYQISHFELGDDTYEFTPLTLSDSSGFGYFIKDRNFHIGFPANVSVPDGFRYPHTWRFSGNYDSTYNTCELANYSDGVYSPNYANNLHAFYLDSLSGTTLNSFSLNPNDSPFDLSNPLSSGNNSWLVNTFGNRLCSISDFDYSGVNEDAPSALSNYPRWDWGSLINIPLVNERHAYEESKPYYYAFNRMVINGSEEVNGVISKRYGISMSDIFNTEVHDISNLTFTFDLFSSPVNRLDYFGSPDSSISNFILGGSIYFDEDYIFKDSDCVYNPTCIQLGVNNYNLSSSVSSSDLSSYDTLSDGTKFFDLYSSLDTYDDIHCSSTQYHVSSGDSDNHIDFQCRYNPSFSSHSYLLSDNIDFRLLSISLMFGGTIGYDDHVISTSGDYTFKDFFVVTNDDWTETDWDATDQGSGGDLPASPGWGAGGGGADGSNVDWYDSLGSMFNFSFVNPFAPIFAMFLGDSSCASISTMAGLLHSEETTVCPWFPSDVRAIMTPVFGLVGLMLVFGFTVRWLGSGSGNYLDDTSGIDSGGYHFGNKYRRKK